jgi:hypothetical protein
VSPALETHVAPLALAVLLGGAVGFEREWHGRPAGLRTHILVCLSATMLIVVSRIVAAGQVDLGEEGRLVFDPNRMGAGIVTGVGFLGAATVIYRRLSVVVQGLETQPLVDEAQREFGRCGMRVLDMATNWNAESDSTELTFHLALRDRDAVPALVERMARVTGVVRARWRYIR